MRVRFPWYAYALALCLGLASTFVMSLSLYTYGWVKGLTVVCVLAAILGAFLGFLWPAKGWAWGLWLAGPFWILVALGFMFAGGLRLLLLKDIPLLTLFTVVECAGAYLGAKARRRRKTH